MKREKAKKKAPLLAPKQTIELQTTFNPTLLIENDSYETSYRLLRKKTSWNM